MRLFLRVLFASFASVCLGSFWVYCGGVNFGEELFGAGLFFLYILLVSSFSSLFSSFSSLFWLALLLFLLVAMVFVGVMFVLFVFIFEDRILMACSISFWLILLSLFVSMSDLIWFICFLKMQKLLFSLRMRRLRRE